MAISNSVTLSPLSAIQYEVVDRSRVDTTASGSVCYQSDLKHKKINEMEHIKWCRRNLGDRGVEWDFWLAGGILYVEVYSEKAKFTYEMWKN